MRILVDLDCVLADFVKGVCDEWGVSLESLMAAWEPGTYPMNAPLAHALGIGAMDDGAFWAILNTKAKFWANLQPLPWARDLIYSISLVTDDWHIISSPSFCESCYAGKVSWIKREFGPKFNRFALTPHKEIFAQPGVVLIDDYEANCEKFKAARGEAILFPAHHNSRHEYKADPLSVVSATLKRIV